MFGPTAISLASLYRHLVKKVQKRPKVSDIERVILFQIHVLSISAIGYQGSYWWLQITMHDPHSVDPSDCQKQLFNPTPKMGFHVLTPSVENDSIQRLPGIVIAKPLLAGFDCPLTPRDRVHRRGGEARERMKYVGQRPYATTPLPSTIYLLPLHTTPGPFHPCKSFSMLLRNLTIRKMAGGCYQVIQDVGMSQRLQSQKIQNQCAYGTLHRVTDNGHQSNSSS